MYTPTTKTSELVAKAHNVAVEVAAKHAADVDQKARFPEEAVNAMKQAKLLSAAVPKDLGGAGSNMEELAAMCFHLSQGCASSGMVFAMHIIQVACVARHGHESEYFKGYMKELVEKQLLMGSVTSEVGVWGDTRSSICAVARKDGKFKLDKDASTASYAAQADDLLVTARRDPDAPPSDQVLVLVRKKDRNLTQTTTWDTMGMRGTCSPGFKLESSGPEEQVLPGSFADASAQTMVSYSHILWAALWLGIAFDAVARASAHVRAEARKTPGQVPMKANHLARLSVKLQTMRNDVQALATEFDRITAMPNGMEELLTVGWALKMNNLKVGASEAVQDIVHEALQIIGINAYKNDSKVSVARHYRDALSAALMISNDRIFQKTASMLLVYKDE
ncbi:MAG: acyl-CoA/acyl-ACP dehydrogenase [Labilithrix sp.]|nr:acyl-CoA/acyl-ACP dehydrogenase [Labilithrix sp.]MCW5811252.1 acyl-CoA/acyl-ACP dehydrogenase [Labilithrix sp.]